MTRSQAWMRKKMHLEKQKNMHEEGMKAHQMYPQLTVRLYGEARDVCLHAWLLIRKSIH